MLGIGRLQVLAAALLFSTGGAGIKAAAFTGLQVSALRSGIAAVVLLMLLRGLSASRGTRMLVLSPAMLGDGRRLRGDGHAVRPLDEADDRGERDLPAGDRAALSAAARAAHPVTSDFAPATSHFSSASRRGWSLCVIGQPEPTTTAPDPVTGNLLAVVCSITWALTLLGLRYIQRDQTQTGAGLSAVTLGNLFASLAAWPFAWPLPAASAVRMGHDRLPRRLSDRCRLCVSHRGDARAARTRGVAAAADRAGAESDLDLDDSW